MNRHPPRAPDERLDAEERALAALLPRPHGRSEPGPDLDARILAAARAATQPAAPPRRRSWIAPTALAASLMLAVGLAWQLRPPESLRAPAAETASASADAGSDAMAVSAFEAPPVAASRAPTAQPQPMAAVPPPAAPPVPAKIANARVAAAAAKPEVAAAAAPPPPPPPAPVVLESPPVAAPMPAPQATESERFAAPAMAKSARAGDAARERASAAGNASAPARDEARQAADATTLDTVAPFPAEAAEPEQPEEEVPPATADSPEVRDAWLRRIGELLKQGKTADAKASLDEFRRRYPEAAIPPELRKLEH